MSKEKRSASSDTQQTTQINQSHDTTNTQEPQADKIGKSREWTCLVYPESAPENWREILQLLFLETYISPIHDKDVNPDGLPKKPHYHVVCAWPGPTTFNNARSLMATFGGVIEPRVVGSLRGICRYLCHLDNPEKAQYNPDEVVCYNGADWTTAINLKSDRYRSIEEMQKFCEKYRITSFQMLNTYAREHRKADWFRTLCDSGAYIMREYCKTLEWQMSNGGCIPTIEDIDRIIEAIDNESEDKQ